MGECSRHAGDPQTLNLYAYAQNNPVTRTDPDGHTPLDWIWKSAGHMMQEVGFAFHNWAGQPGGQSGNCGDPCNVISTAPALSPCFGGDAVCNGAGQVVAEVGLKEDTAVEFGAIGATRGLLSAATSLLPAVSDSAGTQATELATSTTFNTGKGLLNGETTGFTNHGLSRAIERGVTRNEIQDALSQAAKQDTEHPGAFQFNGKGAKVVVSRTTGKIVTVIGKHAPGLPIVK